MRPTSSPFSHPFIHEFIPQPAVASAEGQALGQVWDGAGNVAHVLSAPQGALLSRPGGT